MGILKDGNSTEYTVGSGEVISIDHGNIVLNKGAGVNLKSFDPVTEGLLEGEEALKEFTGSRHQGGAQSTPSDEGLSNASTWTQICATPISTRFLTGTFHLNLNSIFVHHGNYIECDLMYQLSQLE